MPKRAFVTGATGGIGRAVVARLIAQGYQVVAMARHQAALEELCQTYHRQAIPLVGDVTMFIEAWEKALAMTNMASVDLLVCAHGASPLIAPTLDLNILDWMSVFWPDAVGTFLTCQAVGRGMIAQGQGSIVLVSSLHARQTYPQRAPYAMAKAAVCGLARALAVEWGPLGVRVNTVLPWQVAGPRSDALIAAAAARGEDLYQQYVARCPRGALVTPEDVAQAVLALAENASANGTELVLDGGVSQSMWYGAFAPQEQT